eukprot:TRINITY_DN7377_c2_g1_i1.p5 TRINITY_DN7377_c2_g1~~TRINITY_DN7377_c2_g1_i1.p5  ORF type:complete len:119 (-),score=0.89 TRINITY_DN7377_c2_g1_i1:1002-1358(-)
MIKASKLFISTELKQNYLKHLHIQRCKNSSIKRCFKKFQNIDMFVHSKNIGRMKMKNKFELQKYQLLDFGIGTLNLPQPQDMKLYETIYSATKIKAILFKIMLFVQAKTLLDFKCAQN